MCNQHLEVYNNYHHKYLYHTITKGFITFITTTLFFTCYK